MNEKQDTGQKNRAGKRIRAVTMVVLVAVFVCSSLRLAGYYLEYWQQKKLYEAAAAAYLRRLPASAESSAEEEEAEDEQGDVCPIEVDFAALLAENGDIVGWLYCEDTNINYPVVQGKDNEYYLDHSYNGEAGRAGAIFVDADNDSGFGDSNTILYGHHMRDGSMFAHLSDWAEQEYFDAHSEMWLLTPGQDYRVELLGGYLIPGTSGSYTIFTGACPEFDEYLRKAAAAFDVQTEADMPGDGRYIMLSTCEYVYKDARYVLHGRLVPVGEGLQKQ